MEPAGAMAKDKWNVNLSKVSYALTLKLSRSLDVNRGWEIVAATIGFDTEKLQLLELELGRQNGSPTRMLLQDMGIQNFTVKDLYDVLEAAGRKREMEYIQEYVGSVDKKFGPMKNKGSSPVWQMLDNEKKQPPLQLPHSSLPQSFSHSVDSNAMDSQLNYMNASAAMPSTGKHYGDKTMPSPSHSLPSDPSSVYRVPTVPIRPFDKSFESNSSNNSTSANNSIGIATPSPSLNKPPTVINNSPAASICANPQLNTQEKQQVPPHNNSLPGSQQPESAPSCISNPSTPCPTTGIPSAPSTAPTPVMTTTDSLNSSYSPDVDIKVAKTTFTYAQMEEATRHFNPARILGEGTFGVVYRGELNKLDCAIKVLKKTDKDLDEAQLRSELTALFKYQHENIVTLYGYALDGLHLCLVYQYLGNGSLEDRLSLQNDSSPISWERRFNIIQGSVSGLHFLHKFGQQPLIHGDIKSANILLDRYLEAKIGDLGQAAHATCSSSSKTQGFTHFTKADTRTKQFATTAYLDSNGTTNNVKSDIYAMGVVMFEVLSGLKAYDQNRRFNPFLAVYALENVMERLEESEWVGNFQDKQLGSIDSPDLFIDVMKLAKKCTSNRMQARPNSEKLLHSVQEIYKKVPENLPILPPPAASINESGPDSGLNSMEPQIGSNDSTHEAKLSTISSELSSAGHAVSIPVTPECKLSGLSNISSSTKGVLDLQQEKLNEFQAKNYPKLNPDFVDHPSDPKKMAYLCQFNDNAYKEVRPTPDIQGHSNNDGSRAICSPIRQVSEAEIGTMPEALKLQHFYDLQKSGHLSQEIQNSLQNLNVSTDNSSQPGLNDSIKSNPEDYFPKADPEKLAKLMAFDSDLSSETNDNDFVDHPTDPNKIEYLQNLTDNRYFSNKPSFSDNNSCSFNSSNDHLTSGSSLSNANGYSGLDQGNNNSNFSQVCDLTRKESDTDNNAVGLSDTPPVASKKLGKTNKFFSQYKQQIKDL